MPKQSSGALEVGTELPSYTPGRITRATLALFGPASGDLNPIHIDLDFARAAGMEDVFAHGMLSMAYLGRVLTQFVDQRQLRSLSGRFVAITPVLAQPICTGRVVSVDVVDGEHRATVELSIALDDGTQTIAGTAVIAIADPA